MDRIKQQDPVYAPQAYTPMTLRRSFYDQVDNKLPYQPGEYASASAASEIDGPLSNRGYPEYFDTITSAGVCMFKGDRPILLSEMMMVQSSSHKTTTISYSLQLVTS